MPGTKPNTNAAIVDISKSSGVAITWQDGHHSEYGLQYLRDHCPCAMCGKVEKVPLAAEPSNPLPMFKPRARILDVEPVGRYAMRFFWSDGHSTGIYSYEHLRQICPCAECSPASQPSTPSRPSAQSLDK